MNQLEKVNPPNINSVSVLVLACTLWHVFVLHYLGTKIK